MKYPSYPWKILSAYEWGYLYGFRNINPNPNPLWHLEDRNDWVLGWIDGVGDFVDGTGFFAFFPREYCPYCEGSGDNSGYECYECDTSERK